MTHLNKLFTVFLLAVLGITGLQAQNLSLVGELPYGNSLNDIWGYETSTGHEYALVGVRNGLSIVDVSTDPSNPTEVQFIGGPPTTWRDIKVWGDHCYVMTDGTDGGVPAVGLLVVDMTNLPLSVDTVTIRDFGSGVIWTTAHNLQIDENGFLYICGANYGAGGVIITDLNADPMNPAYAGLYDDAYVHDLFVRDNIMWTAEINEGRFAAVDVTVKSTPTVLGTQNTSSNFCHNVWLSDDDATLYTTDEVSNAFIGSYDVSDLSDIKELDLVQSSPGDNVIPHNTFVYGNFLVTAYYTDGVTIHDITYPDNMVETGAYDTSPFSGSGFSGCWGVYPYTTSGLIYASDIEGGLFILDPTFVNAAYLEGIITDEVSLATVFDATITIVGTSNSTTSDISGVYKTGTAGSGTYDVTVSALGYISKTITGVSLTTGAITAQDVQLEPLPIISITGTVIDADSGTPISEAEVVIINPEFEFSTTADADGNFTLSNIYEATYDVVAGKWGHITELIESEALTSASTFDIELDRGYYDDFVFTTSDLTLRWSSVGNTWAGGAWEATIPTAYSWFFPIDITIGKDVSDDIGGRAYVTGNSEEFDFVHGGSVTLFSPDFDPRYMTEPVIKFSAYFFNGDFYGGFGIDEMVIRLTNGTTTVDLDTIRAESPASPEWKDYEYKMSDYMDADAGMQLIVQATSEAAPFYLDDLVEAGFDHFRIEEEVVSGVSPIQAIESKPVYPNPADGHTFIRFADQWNAVDATLNVFSITGKLIKSEQIVTQSNSQKLITSDLNEGVYLWELTGNKGRLTGKFAVQH